jgi:DNA-binding transcriptional ArsR family regulator
VTSPQLHWDWGTAYDLFISLEVLHQPAEFGMRAAWAAGVRARLPAVERETLEQSQSLCRLPLHWIHSLPDPKDTITVLWALGQIPAGQRLSLLGLVPDMPNDVADMLRGVAARQSWDETDLALLQGVFPRLGLEQRPREKLVGMLGWWARAEEFGERYLDALRAYYEVFFSEEEKRLRPVLSEALAQARQLAEGLAVPEFLDKLSQVRMTELPELAELVVVPSYWGTPRVTFGRVGADRGMWVFGARPPDASLEPGDAVPDALLRRLKALSDPTRLRILRYLAREPLTPAQVARRLRLRNQTVAHHLKVLRLAELVHITVGDLQEEKRYATREQATREAFAALESFLESEP